MPPPPPSMYPIQASLSPSTSPKTTSGLEKKNSAGNIHSAAPESQKESPQLGLLSRVSSLNLPTQLSGSKSKFLKPKRRLLDKLKHNDSSKRLSDTKRNSIPNSVNSADETLRHADAPASETQDPGQRRMLIRVFRQNGTFGTFAAPLDATSTQLINLAARKFFIQDPENYRLKFARPDRPCYFASTDTPVKALHDLAVAEGYPHHNREDLSFIGRFILEDVESEQEVLEAFKMKRGRLRLIDWVEDSFPNDFVREYAEKVESIELYKCSLGSMQKFAPLATNVKMCRFRDCALFRTWLPPSLITFGQLQTLDLRQNGLMELNIDFTILPNLKALDLSGNRLAVLPPSLEKCPLQSLFVSTNMLTSFDTFNPLLEELNLDYNKIGSFGPSISNAKNLRRLHLAYNHFTCLPPQLEFTRRLAFLDITGNYISQLGNLDFLSVTTLKMGDNSINFNPVANQDIKRDTSAPHIRLPNLTVADLSFCGQPFVRELFFPLITVLNISGQRLGTIEESLLSSIPNVTSINLSGNELTSLPTNIGSCTKLVELDLSHNSLIQLPNEVTRLSKLSKLCAHSNNLKSLPLMFFKLRALAHLNISSNLFENLEFLDAQQRTLESRRNSVSSWTPDGDDTAAAEAAAASNPFGALKELIVADNRLNDDVFDQLLHATNLRELNLSYNDISEIAPGTLGKLTELRKVYFSGNRISTLPQDEFGKLSKLREFYINTNRLHSIPADISTLECLEVLDVANNNLHYNVCNWPFDWNWRWNKQLRCLNFSSNKRLEIKRADRSRHEDLTDFSVLPNLTLLGLMDVTVLHPSIPDESEDFRIRSYGSEMANFSFGNADILGEEPLALNDFIIDHFRGRPDELLMGLFDGVNTGSTHGNRISRLAKQIFPKIFKEELEKDEKNVKAAFTRAFKVMHAEIGNLAVVGAQEPPSSDLGDHNSPLRFDEADKHAGTGALVSYASGPKCYIASIGGSQMIVTSPDGSYKVLNEVHTTMNRSELDRVRNSGSLIVDRKIDGLSEFTRVLGCYSLGDSIDHTPAFVEHTFDPNDIVIGGSADFWKYISYSTATDIARAEAGNSVAASLKLRDLAIAYGCSSPAVVAVIGPQNAQSRDILKIKRKQGLPQDSLLARLGGEVTPPLGDVTLVFTDIRRSTYLWENMPTVMRSAIKIHNSVMRRTIRLMFGYEVKTEGDAFIVAFHNPVEALVWCLSVQQQLLAADWPRVLLEHDEGRPIYIEDTLVFQGLRVRMGIHRGHPVCEQDPITGRMDYFGPMVNKTARISSVAHGGQITISRALLEQTISSDEDPKSSQMLKDMGCVMVDNGELKLKGIESPEHIYTVYSRMLEPRAKHQWDDNNDMERGPNMIHNNSLSSMWSGGLGVGAQYEMSPRTSTSGDGDLGGQLCSVVHRLEILCSRLRGGTRYGEMIPKLAMYAIESPDQFENVVTRLENAINNLALELSVPGGMSMTELLGLLRQVSGN